MINFKTIIFCIVAQFLLSANAFAKDAEKPFGFKPIYIEGNELSHFEEPKTLLVVFPAKEFGPQKSGYNFHAELPRGSSKTISYDVKFASDFDFVKEGKLPGLCSKDDVSGGIKPTGKNGFSVRVIWRKDGQPAAYVYHMNQEGKYGDIFYGQNARFQRDIWQKIKLVVSINDIDQHNGKIQAYLNEQLFFERSDFVFRTTKSIQIERLMFETFFGGDDITWAPKKQEKLWIRNLEVSK